MTWEEIKKRKEESELNLIDGAEVSLGIPEAQMYGVLISVTPEYVTVRVTRMRFDPPGVRPIVPDFGFSPVDMVLKIRLEKLGYLNERW